MAYCHECGSEVAEIDTFCPFCGITLQPIIVDNDDDLLGSTIVMPSPKKAETPVEQAPADTRTKTADTDRQAEIAIADDESGDSSKSTAAENIKVESASIENSAEDVEPPIAPYNVPLMMTSDSSEKPDEISADSNFEDEIENNIDGLIKKENDHSSSMNDAESEIEEMPSAEKPEPADETGKAEVSPPDFSATIPYIPSEMPDKNFAGDKISGEIGIDMPPNKGEPAVAELPVAKPVEELPEIVCPPPRFDSVRIMEVDSQPKVAEKSALVPEVMKLQTEPPFANADISSDHEKDSRSYTTPNIGLGDTDGKNRAKLKPLDEGTVLNERYEIVRKIGGGGMGAVYLASDKNLGGVLRAVKEMVQSYIEGEQQEKAVNDFKRESVLLSTLDHPAIPTIYDYFFDEKEGRFYLVMKYISGGDLAARIRSAPEGRLDEESVTDWAIQIADVLDYLHNRQMPIVYRDLKPANIMIDGNSGRVMLIDFGIARFINKEEKGVTAVGTMGYAPPELFSGNVEPRSDIYSLGSTMFHLLTGADPQSNPLLIFDFQKHPRPRQINPQLSDQMEKILMRTVEYSAGQRFASAAELRRILEEHLKNLRAKSVSYGVRETPLSAGLSDQFVFCGFCGQKIVATDMFCAFCGAQQPIAGKGIQRESFAPQPLTARLLIVGTNELETPAYHIEKDENLVGRRDPMSNIFPEVDLSKFDPQTKISRRHARIWRDGSQFMVEDLGSSNGTIVLPVISDTVRLMPHQPYALTNGDKLRLGDTTLHFIVG